MLKQLRHKVCDCSLADLEKIGQLVEGLGILLVQVVDIVDIVVTHDRVRVDASESLSRRLERLVVIVRVGIVGKFMPQPNNVSDFVQERVLENVSPEWLDKRLVKYKNILDSVGKEGARDDTTVLFRFEVSDEEVGCCSISGC